MSCITSFFIINLFRSSNFAYERFWKWVDICNRRWKFSFPHIKQKKKYCTKIKKRKLISPFQFPILFSLSPLPILAFENIRCRKCLSSNFLKSYHFKANINNKNNKRIWEASFERKKYTATMKKDTTYGNFYYNTSSISAQIYRAAGWYSRVFASFYYKKDDSRHQRIFSVFTEGLLFTHTI